MDGMNTTVDVAQIAALPVVRQAAQAGEELVGLWPLTGAAHMSNDAKYAENLQVRLSRTLAQVMTGEDVTMPDAEFVTVAMTGMSIMDMVVSMVSAGAGALMTTSARILLFSSGYRWSA